MLRGVALVTASAVSTSPSLVKGATKFVITAGHDAIRKALKKAGTDGVVAALGSLYFSSDIRNAYMKAVEAE